MKNLRYSKLLFVLVWMVKLRFSKEFIFNPRVKPNYKLSFGSCFKYPSFKIDGDSIVFQAIKALKPDSFVWLGDLAYVDKRGMGGIGGHYISDLAYIHEKFEESYNDVSKQNGLFLLTFFKPPRFLLVIFF